MATAKMPGPSELNSPSKVHSMGVPSANPPGQGYEPKETLGLERNPLLDAIMKLKSITSPYAGLGVLPGER